MQRTALLLACLVAVLPVSASAERYELCTQLRDFRMAPFDKDTEGKPLRRAIEFHWVGFWMDFEHGFGKQCHFGGTAPGKVLCDWLPEHTSTEFPAALPMGILTCYGWKIPAKVNDWDVRKAIIAIDTDEDGNQLEDSDRYLQLEIDMQAHKKGDVAIRLSVIPWGEKFLDPQPELRIDEPAAPLNPSSH